MPLRYSSSMKNTQRHELAICGLESVRALASVRPDAVRRFFYSEDHVREFGPLCARLAGLKRAYRLVSPAELQRLSGTHHHQGVVAMVEDRPLPPVTDSVLETWSRNNARIVVLDSIGDDHNLGSIARSAAFFGWEALVTGNDDEGARLTTSAFRVARGALERIKVYADESAARFVNRCGGRLQTVGADHRGASSLQSIAKLTGPLALVLGNEESGLSPAVRNACSSLVRIDGAGTVESLNVSQAAAVFLYSLSPPKPGNRR